MATETKTDLEVRATGLGLTLTGEETIPVLKKMIRDTLDQANEDASRGTIVDDEGATDQPPANQELPPSSPASPDTFTAPASTDSVPMAEVQKMIQAEIAKFKEGMDKPMKPKKVTEHFAHCWRMDGKWIVDYRDQNVGPDGKKIDPYIKSKIHAFRKYNEQEKEFQAWIELVFQDGSLKPMRLDKYIEYRTLVYCPIKKREKIDRSYVIGEVEKKRDNGDMLVGTGIMIDQEVTQYIELFTLETPDGETLTLPDYVIA